jgi:hypothetical protein
MAPESVCAAIAPAVANKASVSRLIISFSLPA